MNDPKERAINQEVLVVNPPLRYPYQVVDNPCLSFIPPLRYFLALRSQQYTVSFIDGFLLKPIRKLKNHIHIGSTSKKIIHLMNAHSAQIVIVHYSSFHRMEGLGSNIISLINELDHKKRIIVADLYDTTSHYIDWDVTQFTEHISHPQVTYFKKEMYPLAITATDLLQVNIAQSDYLKNYFEYLKQCSQLNLIKDVTELVFPLQTSIGCNYTCSFCVQHCIPHKQIALSLIKNQITQCKQQGYGTILITDAYANNNTDQLEQILSHCIEHNIKVHFSNGLGLKHINQKLAKLLSQTCNCIYISPEGSQPVMQQLHKPFSQAKALASIATLAKYNKNIHAHFIVGSPQETMFDFNQTLLFALFLLEEYEITPHFQHYVAHADFLVSNKKQQNRSNLFQVTSLPYEKQFALHAFFKRSETNTQNKIIINSTYCCINNCRFCAISDRPKQDGDLKRQVAAIEQATQHGIQLLDIDGGEPLLYPHLDQLVHRALEAGIKKITITTNGRLLTQPHILKLLTSIPNLLLLVSLHGTTKEMHEWHTNTENSFHETIDGILTATTHFRNAVGLNVTITSRNFAQLPSFITLCKKHHINRLNLQWYVPFGKSDPSLIPPAKALTYVRKAIALAMDNITINLVNFIYCQAPDLYHYMTNDFFKEARDMLFINQQQQNLASFLGSHRYHTNTCQTCPARINCRGFWNYDNQDSTKSKIVDMIDVLPTMKCNSACLYCIATPSMRQEQLPINKISQELQKAVSMFAPHTIRFGGGEPTIFKHLDTLIATAAATHTPEISMQTNGYIFSNRTYLQRCIKAGLTKINLTIKAHNERLYSHITQVPNSWKLVQQALANINATDIPLIIDIACTKPLLPHLIELTEDLRNKGIREINYWYLTCMGNASQHPHLFSTLSETASVLDAIFTKYPLAPFQAYYVPHCLLPNHQDKLWNPAQEKAFIITPTGNFHMENASLDRTVFTKTCTQCSAKGQCQGIGNFYYSQYGDDELFPFN